MVGRCGAIAVVAVALLIGAPLPASAHAELLKSQPAQGAQLGLTPAAVVLDFSEPVYPALSQATVTDPSGRAVKDPATSAFEIRVGLLTNLPGVYRVTWEATSATDGHSTRGSFTFTVERTASAVAASASNSGTALGVVIAIARWIEDAALLLAFGMVFILWLARRDNPLAWVRPRLLPVVLVALVAGLVVVSGEAVAAAAGANAGGVVTYLTDSPAGLSRVGRVLAEALAGIAVATGRRALLPSLTLALVALAASSHAAGSATPWVSVAVDAGHLIAAGIWVGGILTLATLRPPRGWRASGRALLNRFTPWALAGFVTSVALGALQAVPNVGTVSALLTTPYGRLLIVKALGVVAIVPLSVLAWRHRQVHLRAEAVIGIAVIAAAALLASFPVPARSVPLQGTVVPLVTASLPRGNELTLGGQAGQTLVGLTIRPPAPGVDHLTVYVADVSGVASKPVDVTAAIDGRDVLLGSCGDTCRRATVSLMGAETIAVRVAGPQGGTAAFRLPVLPAPSGASLLTAALARMAQLHSVALHETLTGGAGTTIVTDYHEVAPDRLEWTQPNGSAAIVVGANRYTRARSAATWALETGNPTVVEPAFSWGLFAPDIGVHVLGTAMIDAVPTTEIAFFAGSPVTPVWFRFYVDAQDLVRRAEMTAPGHFMTQTFSDFNAPLRIERPSLG